MKAGIAAGWFAALAGLAAVGVGCRSDPPHADPPRGPAHPSEIDRALAELSAFEKAERAVARFESAPTAKEVLGPEPYAIEAIEGGRFIGILRGDDAVVLLDPKLAEIARAPAPQEPTGVSVGRGGEVFVAGALSGEVARFVVHGDTLEETGRARVGRVPRDVAWMDPDALFVLDERDDRLHVVDPDLLRGAPASASSPEISIGTDGGPFRLVTAERLIGVVSLFGHSLALHRIDDGGAPAEQPIGKIVHDGPIWGAAVTAASDGYWIAVGGVEDHPLDRRDGAFGYIDSFVEVWHLARGDGAASALTKRAVVNTSELGVVTPKVVSVATPADGLEVRVIGYGGLVQAQLTWARRAGLPSTGVPVAGTQLDPPRVTTRPLPAGVSDAAFLADGRAALANPLLDAWILDPPWGEAAAAEPWVTPPRASHANPRSTDSRIGEALFFTVLMAPRNSSEGRLSRFTCETCHFEGYVDGRTHHTGRGDTHATTKPLLGLFANAPHFTRALDPDLTTVAHNEFRVAGKGSGADPWFALSLADAPWLANTGVTAETDLSAPALRRALMRFLMDFTHRSNPAAIARTEWSAEERRGAEVFAATCETCHAARLVADDPSTRVPPERWESLVLSRQGPIVWAREGYEKTGIEPYVHRDGARPSSLRRLAKKRPYFTNGSAEDLDAVLERARVDGERFWHQSQAGHPLSAADRQALRAFLDLL